MQRRLCVLEVSNFNSNNDLHDYLINLYTEDGDALPSKFEREYVVDNHDIDFREIEFFDRTLDNLPLLLEGFSFDDVVISNFLETHGDTLTRIVNSIILLYDYQYNEIEDKRLGCVQYLGSVKYR